jgi:anti-sigma factor RsiW
MICQDCKSALPDLLLDPAAPTSAAARAHLESCSTCKEEFQALEATFALLDTWQAPEPSAYFDQKLAVRLREAQAEPPAGWFERLKSRFQFNTGRQLRPAFAGALALLLLVGGGTFADLSSSHHSVSTVPQVSATVNDLQILDKNAQAIQTMDQLLDDGSSDDSPATPPSS